VKIDLVAIGAQNEAAIGQQPLDLPMVRHRVQFDVAAALAGMVFEQAPRGVERVADRDMYVLMGMVRLGVAADDNLSARHLQLDAHAEQIALLLPRMPAFDDHPARNDSVEEALQLLDARADSRLDRG
jgi:hypothetical protein